MANKTWMGRQLTQGQRDYLFIPSGGVVIGATFGVTINGKTIQHTATSALISHVMSRLVSGLSASDAAEFAEVTWTDTSLSGTSLTSGILAVAVTAGKPYSFSLFSSSGNFTSSGLTPNLSPSDVSDGVNWETSGRPLSGDFVFADGRVQTAMLWNLDSMSGTLFGAMTFDAAYRGQVGLFEVDQEGGYPQYRPTMLKVSPQVLSIGTNNGQGTPLCKIDLGSGCQTVTIYKTGAAAEPNREAVTLKSTNASGVLTILNGSVGVAVLGGETSVFANINCGQAGGVNPTVRLGYGVPISGTISIDNGVLSLNSFCQNLNHKNGTATITGSGAITTVTINGGTVLNRGTGPIASLLIGTNGKMDLGSVGQPIMIQQVKMWANSTHLDTGYRGRYSSGFALQGCKINQVTLDLGPSPVLMPVSN